MLLLVSLLFRLRSITKIKYLLYKYRKLLYIYIYIYMCVCVCVCVCVCACVYEGYSIKMVNIFKIRTHILSWNKKCIIFQIILHSLKHFPYENQAFMLLQQKKFLANPTWCFSLYPCLKILLLTESLEKAKQVQSEGQLHISNKSEWNFHCFCSCMRLWKQIKTDLRKTNVIMCNIMAEGFRFMPLGLVRLRTFRLSTWVS